MHRADVRDVVSRTRIDRLMIQQGGTRGHLGHWDTWDRRHVLLSRPFSGELVEEEAPPGVSEEIRGVPFSIDRLIMHHGGTRGHLGQGTFETLGQGTFRDVETVLR